MRRRLDLAASLVGRPAVIFLDEPTTGLDPAKREDMWDVVRRLVDDGSTVLLTTQYLDEADALADEITVIDHGRVIAHDTPEGLKRVVGGQTLRCARPIPAELGAVARDPAPTSTGRARDRPARGVLSVAGQRRRGADRRRWRRLAAGGHRRHRALARTCPAWTRSSSPSPGATATNDDLRGGRGMSSPGNRDRRRRRRRRSPDAPTAARPLLRHSLVLAKRSLIKIVRTPEALIDVTLQPIIFLLLFTYIFGGAIAAARSHAYLQFLLPGILAQTIAMAGDRHRRQPQHRHHEGRLRPVPEPAHRPVGAAGRRGARGRRALRDPVRGASGLRLRAWASGSHTNAL